MTADTEKDAMMLALAIPVGSAKQSFTNINDALLAVFVFGIAIGVEGGEQAMALSDTGEGILRGSEKSSAEFDKFLTANLVMVSSALR